MWGGGGVEERVRRECEGQGGEEQGGRRRVGGGWVYLISFVAWAVVSCEGGSTALSGRSSCGMCARLHG